MKHFALPATAIALVLAACSPTPGTGNNEAAQVPPTTIDLPANTTATPAPAPEATVSANTLTLEGLGDLRIGQPVPATSSFAARGAQEPNGCTTVSSPDYPGVYAIVEGGAVRRISVGERSAVKLIEGIGPGSSEAEVKQAFPGFREFPNKYVEAPAKDLEAPNADSGDSALRFEIGKDGKLSIMHVGTAPVLGYVEGCS